MMALNTDTDEWGLWTPNEDAMMALNTETENAMMALNAETENATLNVKLGNDGGSKCRNWMISSDSERWTKSE